MSRNELCACGSGKRFKHCHGMTQPADAARTDATLRMQALAAHREGALALAETLYRQVIDANPGDIDAQHMLGVVLYERMHYAEALARLCEVAERTGWNAPVVRHNLGLVLAKLMSSEANRRQQWLVDELLSRERLRRAGGPLSPPAISVIVVACNQAGDVEAAIASVTGQALAPVELIVVDAASTDATREAAQRALAGVAMASQVIAHDDRSPASAANAGARAARGGYLAFLDAADRFAPDRLARMANDIVRERPAWGFSGVATVGAGGEVGRTLSGPRARNFLTTEPGSFSLVVFDATERYANLLVARDIHLAIGGFDVGAANAGWRYAWKAAREAEPVVVDAPLYLTPAGAGAPAAASDDEARTAAELLSDALLGSAAVRNQLAPQHPDNRGLLLRTEFRAGHGERVPVPVLRELAALWQRRAPVGATEAADGGGAPRRALVVLGMHRSGTSALSRVLNLCGATLPERVMPPKVGVNPKGFWEPEAVNDIDARLMRHLGGDWNRVDFTLPSEGTLVDEFLDDARDLMATEYGGAALALIKDPRIGVLAPLWHRALQQSGYTPVYVVPVRNPLEVARSLEARGDMAAAEGLALWRAYMDRIEAFTASPDVAAIYVRYTDLLDNWRQVVDAIASRLGVALDPAHAAGEIDGFLESDLRNQRASDAELDAALTGPQGEATRALYRRALARCDRDASLHRDAIDPRDVPGAHIVVPSVPRAVPITPRDAQIAGAGDADDSATFMLCIENNAIREQALMLVESLRTFGGRHANAPVLAYAPRAGLGVDAPTQAALRNLGVEYIDAPLNARCPAYGPANRVYAGAHAEGHASTEFLVVLDSDTLFIDEPRMPVAADVAVRAVDEKGSATRGPGDPFEAYWQQLADIAGVPLDRLPWVVSTIGGERLRASYNAGFSICRRGKGIYARTAALFDASLDAGIRPFRDTGIEIVSSTGNVGTAGSEFWGSSQAALSLAIWGATDRVLEYPDSYNIPLHLIASGGDIDRRWSVARPVHVHYHGTFAARHCETALELLRRLGIAPSILGWIGARVPLAPARHRAPAAVTSP